MLVISFILLERRKDSVVIIRQRIEWQKLCVGVVNTLLLRTQSIKSLKNLTPCYIKMVPIA